MLRSVPSGAPCVCVELRWSSCGVVGCWGAAACAPGRTCRDMKTTSHLGGRKAHTARERRVRYETSTRMLRSDGHDTHSASSLTRTAAEDKGRPVGRRRSVLASREVGGRGRRRETVLRPHRQPTDSAPAPDPDGLAPSDPPGSGACTPPTSGLRAPPRYCRSCPHHTCLPCPRWRGWWIGRRRTGRPASPSVVGDPLPLPTPVATSRPGPPRRGPAPASEVRRAPSARRSTESRLGPWSPSSDSSTVMLNHGERAPPMGLGVGGGTSTPCAGRKGSGWTGLEIQFVQEPFNRTVTSQ